MAKISAEDLPVQGCINSDAQEIISNSLQRRLAELDPHGLKAKQIMGILEAIDMCPPCNEETETAGIKENVKEISGVKSTRVKSKYQEFMSDCLKKDKGSGSTVKQPERMKGCAIRWKEEKKKN